jgi:hypothetical protein
MFVIVCTMCLVSLYCLYANPVFPRPLAPDLVEFWKNYSGLGYIVPPVPVPSVVAAIDLVLV